MTSTNNNIGKPIQLRIIFILNLLMIVLPFVFYYVFTTNDISIGGLDPSYMAYTGFAYIISFIALAAAILRKKMLLFRIIFVINVLIAIPASALIGVLFAIISFTLSYHKKVKVFFNN